MSVTSSPEQLSAAFEAAIRNRDIPAALDLWIDDAAILQPDGTTVTGREEIGAALAALIEHDVDVTVEVARVFTAGPVAVAIGTLTMRGEGAESPYEQRSSSVVIYARDEHGAWRLAIDAPWGLPQP